MVVESWGRFPHAPQCAHPVHWRADIAAHLSQLARKQKHTLAFGNGLSYGDSCLASSGHVLDMRQVDRFLSADWDEGVIRAEAGVTLEVVLALAIPRGWFLPVTPGTRYVTLAGAVANDVHGKNHHVRGTFGNHVRRLHLVRSDGPDQECSPRENADMFAATIGGLGLTGIITWVELQLMPIRSSRIVGTSIRFGSLDEFFTLSNELDPLHEYTVAWIDCLARGSDAGRGVYMVGNHALDGCLEIDPGRQLSVPFVLPFSAVNQLSLRLFNTIYYRARKSGRHSQVIPYAPFFYPLDKILHWNRLYGPRGFQQYQCVIPECHAEAAMLEILRTVATSGTGSFLAVLKRCGDVCSPGLLSFPLPGTTLALDFPRGRDTNNSLFPRLDAIVRAAGGRLYPAKDAAMRGEDFRAFYPNWEQLESLRDPVLCSRFWKRVTP
ncbi:FAD-binding oxidoreductase [Desulfonatronum thioautotrophicum]|uniref:FAD-binding oxidoreductase n=1 Tax=Desulfonatronum thioautotrophicum TaxID=617001 RepID=UPI001ABFCB79|nr:FAD-binding oxidoreductase [Desulfonatronum thioautotrophicum]